MKTIILTTLAFFASTFIFSQTPAWQWAKSAGGSDSDLGNSIATDANGNVYVTGDFASSSITFGSFTLNNNGSGTSDIFIVKYSNNGDVLWAKSAGGDNEEAGQSISVDAIGNVYVTGYFASSSITFGPSTMSNNGGGDIFLAKYDASGNALWGEKAGGTNDDVATGVTTDNSGNVIVTGGFVSSSITFGSTTLNNASAGFGEVFIAKYGSNGNVLWARSGEGKGNDWGRSISADQNGNVFVTGTYEDSSIYFASFALGVALGNNGNTDIFLVKYDVNGELLWARSAGGSDFEWSSSVAADNNGNVFVTGAFSSSSIMFFPFMVFNPSSGNDDIFLAKYDANGDAQWAKSAGGYSNDVGYSLSLDNNGNLYATGYFQSSSVIFGSDTLNNVTPNWHDIFLAKYNSITGDVIWAERAGGAESDDSYGISSDDNGNVYVTGRFFNSSAAFGSITLSNSGFNDIFIAKYGSITGMEEKISNQFAVSIYPNPVSTHAELRIQNLPAGRQGAELNKNFNPSVNRQALQFMMYNVWGEEVRKIPINHQSSIINCQDLPDGTYFYKLAAKEQIVGSGKLVIQ